ncbi:hypothetical protein HU200_031225 [Digitaria exilis]|uniref:Leucine-rich repeat-containing N-terminal plant-type domain-containing protein n=1 Tax=Digitaria exilis TaxID=1010633 RepID=A0A835BVY1_9POAL|nr:hypothetical protein HU200_031225 [Digitaria exilis]
MGTDSEEAASPTGAATGCGGDTHRSGDDALPPLPCSRKKEKRNGTRQRRRAENRTTPLVAVANEPVGVPSPLLASQDDMAVRSAGRWLLPLLLLLLLCSFVPMSSAALVAAGEAGGGGDEAALLAFKTAAISGGAGDPLASWNASAATGDGASYCSWEGVRCGGSRRVVALSLYSYGLPGTLSPSIGNLTFLQVLNLSSNGFQGTIPASIGRLVRLEVLELSYNTFSGALPANLTSCASLLLLAVGDNQLHGSIPVELGHTIGIGVACSKQQPRDRIPVRDAVVEMRAIRDTFHMVARSLDGKL